MFGNDALKRILCDRDVKEERGRSANFVTEVTFDLELHGALTPNRAGYSEKSSNPKEF
jgi:hypothetical protein